MISLAGAATVAIATGWVLGRSELSTASLLVLGIALVLGAPIAVRIARRTFDPFEPIILFAAAFGVMFVLRPFAMLQAHDLVYRGPGVTINVDGSFTRMCLLGLVGALAFVIGHEGRWGHGIARRLRPPVQSADLAVPVTIAIGLSLIGLMLFALFLMQLGGPSALGLVLAGRSEQLAQGVSAASKYYYFGPYLLIPATLLLVAIGWRRRQHTLYFAAAGTASIVILLRGSVGSRSVLLPLFAGLLLYVYATHGRRPRLVGLVCGAAIALTLSSLIVNTRDANTRSTVGFAGVLVEHVRDPQIILDPLLSGGDAAEAPALAAALTVVPSEIPHTYGMATVGDLLVRVIPRVLWPGKPQAPREVVVEALSPTLYHRALANPEFSTLFSWYLDAGIPGVAAGLFLFGVACRSGYEWFRLHERNMMARLMYAALLPMLVTLVRDSPTDGLIRAAFIGVPIWFAFWLPGRLQRRDSARRV